jgi:hypothetical protein
MHTCIERRHDHLRPEVAAADADVDDVPNAARCRVAHRFRVGQHRIEHAMDVVAERPLPPGSAQRAVQHRAAFRDVDGLAVEHGVAPAFDAALACKIEQELRRRRIEQILRQVGIDLRRLHAHDLEPIRMPREGVAQVEPAAVAVVMVLQRLPRAGPVAARPGRASLRRVALRRVHRAVSFILSFRNRSRSGAKFAYSGNSAPPMARASLPMVPASTLGRATPSQL